MMLLKAQCLWTLASSLLLANASSLHASYTDGLPLPAKTIFQFNKTGTWLENAAVRPNGDLLMSMLTPTASLYTLKRPYSPSPKASLVHNFDGANGLGGITEISPDTFALIAAQYRRAGSPVPGTYAIWEVSFKKNATHSVRKITDIPEAGLANGIATVPTHGGKVVLISDSFLGSLWRLDTQTGHYESVMKVTEMAVVEGAAIPVGINGVKVRDGYVYWTNSALVEIFRTRIDNRGYPVSNTTVEKIATIDSPMLDDFAIDKTGSLWVATNGDNKVDVVRPNGSYEVAVGGDKEFAVAGDSAVAFGRTLRDKHTLYVVTSGALSAPINNRTEPAKVVAVDTTGFSKLGV
ncbi:hypothetical protein F4779DRAFT_629908 [Xylariaceae sp. FL0662B]|nr:hypothetical protein F4779DRAFT_629908 [Xylariaceae sp. FL0662B]